MKRVCCLLLFLVLMILCASCDFAPQESKFYWIPEESFFVDYEITENKTVRFRYSIALVNDYDAFEFPHFFKQKVGIQIWKAEVEAVLVN